MFKPRSHAVLVIVGLALAIGLAHALTYQPSEPFFYNDETRHVMTGVYFRDLLYDLPVSHLRDYTVRYYLQYPALGLLVWPPFFYFLEGLLMSIFGTSIVVSKMLVFLFAVMACSYLYLLARRSHGSLKAAIAALVFGFSPLVFVYSHYVMLEVPTLALGLAATYHFIRYLDLMRRRDLLFAGLAAALAALTRFDAVYLLPLFIILILVRKRWELLWRREVLAVAVLALLLVAPFYALIAREIGWFHMRQATETLSTNFPPFLSLKRLFFYPSYLREQFGLVALIPALIGIAASLTAARRAAIWLYLAIIAATYLTFTPIGEMDSRHAIYWIPAFALFAAEGIAVVVGWLRTPKLYLPLTALVVAGVAWTSMGKAQPFVRGYAEAASYVVANSGDSSFCLFVGGSSGLNGDFIYQIRRYDAGRRLWTLRDDKLFFSVLINSKVDYRQNTASDQDILDTIFKYDPAFIVMEDETEAMIVPEEQRMSAAMEDRVRRVVRSNPERFQLERTIPVESNTAEKRGTRLQIFRNVLRNQNPERRLEIDMLILRRSVEAQVP